MITVDTKLRKVAGQTGNIYAAQTLFFNLYTCGTGSQVTGTLGVTPPTVHEYLYSCNNNLLIEVPFDEAEEEFQQDNAFYI